MNDENTMVYNRIGKYGSDPLKGTEREVLEWSRNRDVDWRMDLKRLFTRSTERIAPAEARG